MLEIPGAPLPPDSRFYVERPPIEDLAYAEISKPGSLIRVRGAKRMGKSSLMLRLIKHAIALEYKVVEIDFRKADAAIFEHPRLFFRWFCQLITHQLHLPLQLDEYWDDSVGSKLSCTLYLEEYLLPQINCPLVLLLNEISQIFQYPTIAKEFLPLIRFWYEQARQVDVWQQLRQVVLHSTEIYVALSFHQSPFNVGLPLQLIPLTSDQVVELAQKYGLDLQPTDVNALLTLTGGQPYLVQLVFYQVCDRQMPLQTVLETATSSHGVYADHLQNLSMVLQRQPTLSKAFQQASSAQGWVALEPSAAYQLDSLGLVIMNGIECQVSCQLYQQYFAQPQHPFTEIRHQRIAQLEAENQRLKALATIDPLTNIANRRHFDQRLQEEWRRSLREGSPLSLILGDIDCFKSYNDTQGHQVGDHCLQQVAAAMKITLKRPGDLVARYGGEEFAVILPNTDAEEAMKVAESICVAIRILEIAHPATQVASRTPSIITMSFGVASILPDIRSQPSHLIQAADNALYHSKSQGRDRVTLSPVFAFTKDY